MSKLLVISDSHGSPEIISMIVRQELPFDELIFCGDGAADIESAQLPKSFIINHVAGNVDRLHNKRLDDMLIVETDGLRILVSHGDFFSVKSTLGLISLEGLKNNADLVVFGHTHVPLYKGNQKPVLLNPGSVKNGCYATIEITEGKIRCILKEIA